MNDYKFYLNLTEEESIEYANKAIEETNDIQQLEDILLHLALFTNGNCLRRHYFALISLGIFYPSEIYLHADEHVANELIKLIENDADSVSVNHLLCCLAWIGTPNVINFFVESSIEKPNWTKGLYILPKEYAEQAGWFVNEDNRKVLLINRHVSVFAKQDLNSGNNARSRTFEEKKSICNFCKNNLTTVFEIKIDSSQIPFTTCLLCCCYEPFFMSTDGQGNSIWHHANKKWSHFDNYELEIQKIKENSIVISGEMRKPEFTISQLVAISKSQIGGYPTWVQDADYLNCPDCNQKMLYIGQVDMEDVEDYNEGIYYFHSMYRTAD